MKCEVFEKINGFFIHVYGEIICQLICNFQKDILRILNIPFKCWSCKGEFIWMVMSNYLANAGHKWHRLTVKKLIIQGYSKGRQLFKQWLAVWNISGHFFIHQNNRYPNSPCNYTVRHLVLLEFLGKERNLLRQYSQFLETLFLEISSPFVFLHGIVE